MKTFFIAIVVVLFQVTYGIPCTSNPCNHVPGVFDESTGYCCYSIPPTNTDSVCICPNNVAPVVNAPCRVGAVTNQATCNRTCANGGVCNVVNGQQVCWCTLGFSGAFCELQGVATTCAARGCVAGTCAEQTIGASRFSYCHCQPGWTGTNCEQCYFTCTQAGVFPDTAYLSIGRYFYCPAAMGAPISAMCPDGQRFNSLTSQCGPIIKK